ncbi:MAG: helix-turn-helix domain-containing protein [Candidatus Pacebacteria bacterium]|nr:helix-turn-helix domain-containing protein [Candidatus Paceibacterota bacterium]
MDILSLELRKIGLTEKEVSVYLAGLELGPSSVQTIASKTGITRPTTYEIIRKLNEKDLFTELFENKRRLFAANPPEKLLNILRIKKRESEEKEREFVRIIAALESKYVKSNGVKEYKEKEGFEALREIISFSSTQDIIIVNPQNIAKEIKTAVFDVKKRLGKINLSEFNSKKISGSLMIFDKTLFFPSGSSSGFLIENPLITSLFKSLLFEIKK